jgi:sugar/nucleoside kinase (ribokinase family)
MRPTITVVGDALLDVHVRPDGPIRPGADVPARVRLEPGGQGANVAIRLARRGVDASIVCALGPDAGGSLIRRALEADDVVVASVPAAATGAVVVLVDPLGERTMLSQRAPFAATAVDSLPAGGDWIVVSGYLLLEPAAEELVRRIVARGPRRALLGCAVPGPLVDRWRHAADLLVPDLVILSRDETSLVDLESTAGWVATDPTGAEARIGAAAARAATPAGESAVDTTGAGDAFAAVLLADLAGGWPPDEPALERALQRATASGAAVTRVIGAQGRVPGEPAGTLPP